MVAKSIRAVPVLSSQYTRDWVRYLTTAGTFPGLDYLRATAIILVMVWHADNILQIGWIGVNLFFVLSGFLVGGSVLAALDRKSFDASIYFSARFLRIYPLYMFSVVLYFLLALAQHNTSPDTLVTTILLHATFLQTLAPFVEVPLNLHYSVYQVTWSLVVEVLFYITLPLILIPLHRLGLKGIMYGLLVVLAAYPFLRAYLVSPHLADDNNWHFFHFLRPHFRLDEMYYGVLGAVILRYFGKAAILRHSVHLLALGAIIIGATCAYMLIFVSNPLGAPLIGMLTRQVVWMPTILALGFLLLLLWSLRLDHAPAAVVVCARLAYPLYLMHELVRNVIKSADFHYVGYFSISLAVALLASYCVEYPFIRMYKNERKPAQSSASAITG